MLGLRFGMLAPGSTAGHAIVGSCWSHRPDRMKGAVATRSGAAKDAAAQVHPLGMTIRRSVVETLFVAPSRGWIRA
jgi:hypothetical protein